MTPAEIELYTKLTAEIVDYTLKAGKEGDEAFELIVLAINKILIATRRDGLKSKYEVVELATRAWLVWQAYQVDHNPEVLATLKDIAVKLLDVMKHVNALSDQSSENSG